MLEGSEDGYLDLWGREGMRAGVEDDDNGIFLKGLQKSVYWQKSEKKEVKVIELKEPRFII